MPDEMHAPARLADELVRARAALTEAAVTADRQELVDGVVEAIDRALAGLEPARGCETVHPGVGRPRSATPTAAESVEELRREVARLSALAGENAQLREDVHDAIKARDAERERLQQILDVLPEGIVIVDIRGQVIMSNAAARALWGQPALTPAAVGHSPAGVSRLDGNPWPAEEMPLARSIQQGEVVQGEQMLIASPITGRQVPVLINSAPLRNTAGTIVGGVAVFQDISPIKDLERQKDQFLALISHDLRNPLATIKSLAQLLQRQLALDVDPAEVRIADRLDAIARTATRASAILADISDIARLQMGRPLVLDLRLTDLVSLVQRVVADHQEIFEQHRIVLEIPIPSLVGWWDSARLERVVDNLVSNAIKYSPDGGDIVVALTREEDAAGAWAVLQVRDQGIGIPANELDQVFAGFFRASNVVGRIEGTGIGLAGAHQIVTQHGGQLSVESQEGSGSTFTVRLPLESRRVTSGKTSGKRKAAGG